MNREEAQNLLANLEYIRAFADGKDIEFRTLAGSWIDSGHPMFALDHHRYRIKPEPAPVEYVPLEPEDVPPGSVFFLDIAMGINDWLAPAAVTGRGVEWAVELGDRLVPSCLSFSHLKDTGWQIKRPGEGWQPCKKVKPTA